jgi:hypothetical protein
VSSGVFATHPHLLGDLLEDTPSIAMLPGITAVTFAALLTALLVLLTCRLVCLLCCPVCAVDLLKAEDKHAHPVLLAHWLVLVLVLPADLPARLLSCVCSGVFATHLHLLVDILKDNPGIADYKMEVVLTAGGEAAAAAEAEAAATGGHTQLLIISKHVTPLEKHWHKQRWDVSKRFVGPTCGSQAGLCIQFGVGEPC